MRSLWDVEDPTLRHESLEKLSVLFTGQAVDAYWSFLNPRTVAEVEKIRRQQIIRMARYARQSLFIWDDVEIIVLSEYMNDLAEVLEKEGGVDDLKG